MKNALVFICFLSAHFLSAQTHSIQGRVLDENGGGMPGATVKLELATGEMAKGAVTDLNGQFVINSVDSGAYILKITILGYTELIKNITANESVNLGNLTLVPDSRVLDQVEVKSQMITAIQKGDTSEFNAGAFKVMKDANAEDLIEKMPGVTVENGQMKTQGENVQQVLVDGKPFFGNDPTAALKNLPAELIEKVQIFDAQSDQAQFTGFNDGTTTKTINIVTKGGMQNGQFGKVYAGYGYEDKYQAGGNINFFDGDRRISLIGMTNNINVQNFAAEDLVGAMGGGQGGGGNRGGRGGGGGRQGGGGNVGDFLVGSSGGISTTNAFGLNYSDKWGKKIDVSGSYFFNKSVNNSERITSRQFLNDESVLDEIYDENSTSRTNNVNHRLNLRVEFKLDSMNSIMLRPRLTLQQNDGNASTIGQTVLGSMVLNSSVNNYLSDLNGVNFSNSLLYRHKFQKKGRTISLDLTTGYAPKKGESTLQSINGFFADTLASIDSLDQRSRLDVENWNMAGNLEYTEPLGANGQLLLNYRHSYQQESSDRRVFDWAEATGEYDLLNEPLSNVFSNDYETQQGGIGYNFTKGRDFNLSARVNTQWAQLANDQTFPQETMLNTDFFNVLPSANLRYNVDKNRNIRLNYRASTQLPSVEQLQNVVTNNNPLLLTAGNPGLGQSEQHNMFLRYQAVNPTKSTSFFFMAGGSLTSDYIGRSTFLASSDNPIFDDLEVQPGAQLTIPVNLDGYRNARSFISYGMPIKFIKSNLNFDVSYNYGRTPGLVNEALNFVTTNSFGAGFTLSSNVSDHLDFSISTRPIWNNSKNTLQTAANAQYLTQNSRAKLNWQIAEGFVLRTDLMHNLYSGLSAGFNQNYWLWNLAIGKKIFKNERGEISLAVNDLLNQNRNVFRTITESYIEDTQTNALTRFVMLSFTYNLRNFNTGKKADALPRGEGMPGGGGEFRTRN